MEKGSFSSIPDLVRLAKFEPNETILKIIESVKDSKEAAILNSDSITGITKND